MMPISGNAVLWLSAGVVMLTALGLSARAVSQVRRQQGDVQARLMAVMVLHGPTRATAKRRGRAKQDWSKYMPFILNLAGYDPDRKAQYPLPWWVVLIGAAALARAEAALTGVLVGDVALLQLPIMVFVFSRFYWRYYDKKRQKLLYMQLPDALGTIVRSVRVGIPVTESLRAVARDAPEPTAEEFRRLADQVRIGAALEKALIETAARSGVAEYRFFATAIALQAQTGGGLTETLETLSDVIRKRIALRKRGFALAAEARTSAALLAALPFVTAGALALLNPSYIAVLITDPTGRKILAAAFGMLFMGMGVMKLIIRKSLS
jgi:tight adherence protein B